MSLDITLSAMRSTVVFDANLTHNLAKMADEAGIYKALWRPEESGLKLAGELIPVLAEGLAWLERDPERFKALNPENGWGSYDTFVPVVRSYLQACRENPDAEIRARR